MKTALEHYHESKNLPYPSEIEPTMLWAAELEAIREAAEKSPSESELILLGQNRRYNHRRKAGPLLFMIKDLFEKKFPGVSLYPGESTHCAANSVTAYNEFLLSDIYFWHLAHYHTVMQTIGELEYNDDVVEIGSGLGELARIWMLLQPQTRYTLVDFPESLLIAEAFLRKNFPHTEIAYHPELRPLNGFYLVPIQSATKVGMDHAIVLNIASLQEQRTAAVKYWMRWIESGARYFYSFNSFMNSEYADLTEPKDSTATEVVPILDNKWIVRHFELSPEMIRINTTCEWLAVVLERNYLFDESNNKGSIKVLLQAGLNPFLGSRTSTRIMWELFWKDPTNPGAEAWVRYLEKLHYRDAKGLRRIINEHKEAEPE